jgi:hypothetical protein
MPVFKLVQPAKLLHHVLPRAHPQVKGVAQNNLRAHLVQVARHHAFDGAIRAYGHKDWSFYHTVVQRQAATARMAA